MKFKQYINERTFKIGVDVDYIYKKLFHPYIKILPNIEKFLQEIYPLSVKFGTVDSSELKTKDARIAHELNSITIEGSPVGQNMYLPRDNKITIGLNADVISILKSNPTYEQVEKLLGKPTVKRFFNELKPTNIKGSIYHELSHWINDTLHNRNISKRIRKSNELGDFSVLTRWGSTLFTDYELDAQVHAIKQIKRDYKKNWDKLTWENIIEIKSSFHVVFLKLKSVDKKTQENYFKLLMKRLNREKLLGKGLRNSFFSTIRNI